MFVMRAGRSKIIDRAVREDAVKAEILALQPEVARGRIRLAKLIRRIDQSAHFVYESCASLGEWGERLVWVVRTITEDPKRNGNGRIRPAPQRGKRAHYPPG